MKLIQNLNSQTNETAETHLEENFSASGSGSLEIDECLEENGGNDWE